MAELFKTKKKAASKKRKPKLDVDYATKTAKIIPQTNPILDWLAHKHGTIQVNAVAEYMAPHNGAEYDEIVERLRPLAFTSRSGRSVVSVDALRKLFS